MSTIEDFRSTTFAATPYEDLTVAEAWASSPLGDPELEDGSLSGPVAPEDPAATPVTAKPRSGGTKALVAGAVVAARADRRPAADHRPADCHLAW
ncbi:hypothetical protein, partial [Mycobacterium sp. E1715]|uniref:hypothetical protein n=1 Tax=Mycobacterium sp. E1715 TaxID=1856863 RepID=UPI0018D36B1B